MKINHIIREKRKELSLTQEQVAEFLGVSTPAVSRLIMLRKPPALSATSRCDTPGRK